MERSVFSIRPLRRWPPRVEFDPPAARLAISWFAELAMDKNVQLVKIVESSRIAWQGLPRPVPPEVKADYLRVLLLAGFGHVDAVSFVSGEAVAQRGDAETVLEYLSPGGAVETLGLVATAGGAERAVKSGAVSTLLFSYSISPGFLERNQRQTPEETLEELEQVGEIAYKAGLDVAGNVAMAFGNPFGDSWDIDEVVSATDLLLDAGVAQVVLEDTTGEAPAGRIHDVLRLLRDVHGELEIGLSLRSTPQEAALKISAAYEAGCRQFHSVLGGLGGSEFVADVGAGMLATETVLRVLGELGASLPELEPLDRLIAASRGIEQSYGAMRQ